MSKRDKRKAKQKAAKAQRSQRFSQAKSLSRTADALSSMLRAGELIDSGKSDEALEILEPLLAEFDSPEILTTAAIAYVEVGDLWSAIICFERAQKHGLHPDVWATMATIYLQLGMHTYALQALHNALKGRSEADEDRPTLQLMQETLQQEVDALVASIGVPASQAETGLRHHDDAQRALSQNDYQAAIDANRRAIRFLGKWPPVHNNLAQALLYNGQPAEALAATRAVLANDPNNIHALANAIKISFWAGKRDEAQELWEQLRLIEPANALERFKQSEAAAVMDDDESVIQILKPLVEAEMDEDYELDGQLILRFAVAEANLGQHDSALKRLQALGVDQPLVQLLSTALRAKQPGVGWATRYSYFGVSEVLPMTAFDAVIELIDQEDELDEKQFRKRINRLLEQYPQLFLVAKRILWEQMEGEYGVAILRMIASPAAYDALREFAFSQAGSDEDRMEAIMTLQEAGVLDAAQPVRMWKDGKWSDVKLDASTVRATGTAEPEIVYSPTVQKLYDRAEEAYSQGNYRETERLYKQIVALEPRAANAYFNLGVAQVMQDREQEGIAMFRKALELRPDYPSARIQLANFRLEEQDVAGAKALMAPLNDVKQITEREMPTYLYVQARILMLEGDFVNARGILEILLTAAPNMTPAQDLLRQIQMLETLGGNIPRSGGREIKPSTRGSR